MAFALAVIAVNIIGSVVFISIALSLLRGAPPVPSKQKVITAIIEIAQQYSTTNAVDLGAGDGRIVRALAAKGITAYGYEINPLLVWWGNMRLQKNGLHKQGMLKTANLWSQPIQKFDLVVIYGLPSLMPRFEQKLEAELRPGALVISNSFPLPTWKPIKQIENVYLYQK